MIVEADRDEVGVDGEFLVGRNQVVADRLGEGGEVVEGGVVEV